MSKPSLLDDSYSETELAGQLNKSERTVQRMRRLRIGPPFSGWKNSTIQHRVGARVVAFARGTASKAKGVKI
jgi:hypothetical protein